MQFKVNVIDPSFTETFLRKNDSRNIFLTLTYKFGTELKQQPKKPKDNGNNDNNPTNGLGF